MDRAFFGFGLGILRIVRVGDPSDSSSCEFEFEAVPGKRSSSECRKKGGAIFRVSEKMGVGFPSVGKGGCGFSECGNRWESGEAAGDFLTGWTGWTGMLWGRGRRGRGRI